MGVWDWIINFKLNQSKINFLKTCACKVQLYTLGILNNIAQQQRAPTQLFLHIISYLIGILNLTLVCCLVLTYFIGLKTHVPLHWETDALSNWYCCTIPIGFLPPPLSTQRFHCICKAGEHMFGLNSQWMQPSAQDSTWPEPCTRMRLAFVQVC